MSKKLKRILSPFAEYHGRKAVDECEEFPLRRDSAPDEAVGRRYPDREVVGASSGQLPLFLILGLASFLRFFRLSDLLGFWYDQGRDALVIWDMLYKGKLTLIGPMMGFTGIFRGAWYYWIIAPFYWLGKGNPIYPSVFLIIFLLNILIIQIKLKFVDRQSGIGKIDTTINFGGITVEERTRVSPI